MAETVLLLEQFKNGSHDAFAELFSAYTDPVYRFFLVKTTGNQDRAEDLLQETFVKVWKGRVQFDTSRSFKAWLFGIAYNTWVDHLRREKIVYELEEYELPDPSPSLLDRTHEKLLVEKVIAELNTFPTETREVILLSFIGGLTSDEISEAIQKTPSAVRMIKKRTIDKLQQKLAGEYNE